MSNQNPKIKKVINTLSEGSKSLKNNPSEENRREWEGKIEEAGNSTNWTPYIIAGAIAIMCMVAFFVSAGGVAISTASTTNQTSSNNGANTNNSVSSSDSSQFTNVYADQIVNGYNENGARIHVTFRVDNRSGVHCMILVFFFDEYGNPIQGYNPSSIQKNGQIARGQDFTPNIDSVEASTLIFVPIEEFQLENGSSTIKYQIEMYEVSSGALIVQSDLYSFTISQ